MLIQHILNYGTVFFCNTAASLGGKLADHGVTRVQPDYPMPNTPQKAIQLHDNLFCVTCLYY